MLRALIVDDEQNSRESLRGKLSLFCPDVQIVEEAADVESAQTALQEHQPEVVFLDIDLAGASGFDLLEATGVERAKVRPAIIFITAHDEFAIQAIRFSALDYLLKPIDPEDLVRAVRRAQEEAGIPAGNARYEVLLENIRQAADSPKKIVVPTSDGMHVIKVNDILRLESSSNYTIFYLKNEKKLMASKTLKEFDAMLEGYSFSRVHKSHLVNLNYLSRYVQTDGGYVILEDNSRVPVANRKKEQLMAILRKL